MAHMIFPFFISEISEIPDISFATSGHHFLASVCWGALAGTLALMASLLLVMAPATPAGDVIGGAIFIVIFAGLFTLVGMTLVGLPVTALYRAAGAEHRYLYAATGGIAGFVFLVLVFHTPPLHDPEALALAGSGGVAGFAAAWRWGRWREALAALNSLQQGQRRAGKRSNPIHDLIH